MGIAIGEGCQPSLLRLDESETEGGSGFDLETVASPRGTRGERETKEPTAGEGMKVWPGGGEAVGPSVDEGPREPKEDSMATFWETPAVAWCSMAWEGEAVSLGYRVARPGVAPVCGSS